MKHHTELNKKKFNTHRPTHSPVQAPPTPARMCPHPQIHHLSSSQDATHLPRLPWALSHRFLCQNLKIYSVTRPKNRFCWTIWLAFVCVHGHSYVCMRHENVSGSFETPSCFRNVHTLHELTCVRKVVTHSLPRFLLVHVTYRHM